MFRDCSACKYCSVDYSFDDCQTVRLLLQNNLVDWGVAYKRNNSTQYSYLIYPKKFYEETGFYYSGKE